MSKNKREGSNTVSSSENLSKKEVLRKLPEIEEINDRRLREQTIDVFANYAPEYFWKVPASSSGKYHPRDTTGEHGLWIHVKRSFQAFERIADSYEEQGKITSQERDYGRSAILLHDLFKQGLPPRDEEHTTKDHDKVCARFLERKTDLPQEVIDCIDSHNGAWNEGKDPEGDLEQIHHLADMVSSGRTIYIELLKPVPQELKGKTVFESESLSKGV